MDFTSVLVSIAWCWSRYALSICAIYHCAISRPCVRRRTANTERKFYKCQSEALRTANTKRKFYKCQSEVRRTANTKRKVHNPWGCWGMYG